MGADKHSKHEVARVFREFLKKDIKPYERTSTEVGTMITGCTLTDELDAELVGRSREMRRTPHAVMRLAIEMLVAGKLEPKRPTDFRKTRRGEGSNQRTVNLPPILFRKFDAICRKRRCSRSMLIRATVKRFLRPLE